MRVHPVLGIELGEPGSLCRGLERRNRPGEPLLDPFRRPITAFLSLPGARRR